MRRKRSRSSAVATKPARRAIVWIVQHVHEISEFNEDIKFIGVYATRTAARDAVRRLARQPGFRSARRGFHVTGYEIGVDHWTEGYVTEGLRGTRADAR